jgi:putative endopeptidase
MASSKGAIMISRFSQFGLTLSMGFTLSACASDPEPKPDPAPQEEPSAAPAAEETQPVLSSGIAMENFDKSVKPQEEFYEYVNGTWLKTFEIPADKSNYGSFTKLADEAEENLKGIITNPTAASGEAGSESRKIADAYAAFMNTEKANALGITPLDAERKTIQDLKDKKALAGHLAYLSTIGVKNPIGGWVNQDAKNTTEYLIYLSQSGLGMPDRDYYLKEEEKFQKTREAYEKYIADLLTLAGKKDGAKVAKSILALEKALAEKQWSRVQNRDRDKTYNKMDPAALGKLVGSLDWGTYFKAGGLDAVPTVIVRQPDYFSAFGAQLKNTPLSAWKDYLEFHLINSYASKLSDDYVNLKFDFYGKVLSGTPENRPRWKRGVSNVQSMLGEAVGKVYVEKHFRPEAKVRMEELVANLRQAFKEGIDDLQWMTDTTKTKAHEKLGKFVTKIGYPDEWRDYSSLEIKADDLVGNYKRSRLFEHKREIGKLGKPIDRGEWFMYPQTVNAYYNPPMNEIVFPAAILQPPFFNVEADDAVNYGAIGAVIGHEFSHGFDDQGRKSDGDGNLTDWWTPEDAEEFKARAQKMVDQYSAFSPVEGANVNGEFTLGENIADVSGLTVAFRAYKLSLKGKPSPVIDGFTGEQRFFLGWSQIWARKYRDAELRKRLVTDPHSPSRYRVLGVVSNMPEFYEAFGVKETDPLFRKKEERVKIW